MVRVMAGVVTARYVERYMAGTMKVFVTATMLLTIVACEPDFDLILEGGTVIDGTGAPGVVADVGVRDGLISEVGALGGRSARERIDVQGHVVAPGFIDPQNDGGSPLDLGQWYDSLAANGGTAPNFAMFVGHGSIRSEVIGDADRAPTEVELEEMAAFVTRAMDDGALGLSTGLFYLPGSFAETEEVIALAREAATEGGIYISHMRNEGDGVFESVRETIRIGREAGIPVQMTHHKIGAWRNFGRGAESIELMREARAEGIDITFDQYPYTASSTGLSSIIPRWAQEGGRLDERLGDPATRRRVVDDMVAWIEMRFAGDPSRG